jgi:hypothetical protein
MEARRESGMLALQGMGPGSLPELRAALSRAGLRFKEREERA